MPASLQCPRLITQNIRARQRLRLNLLTHILLGLTVSSYTHSRRFHPAPVSVGLSGLEPLTPALSAQCSNLLSYRPFYLLRWWGFSPQGTLTQRFASPPLTPTCLRSLRCLLDSLSPARSIAQALQTSAHHSITCNSNSKCQRHINR